MRTVAFDKTGTLTFGTPGVARVYSALPDLAPQELLRLTSAAEERSEHPLGKAIVRHFRTTGEKAAQAEDFRMLPGRGVSARSDGRQVLAGNAALLAENGITLPRSWRRKRRPPGSRGSPSSMWRWTARRPDWWLWPTSCGPRRRRPLPDSSAAAWRPYC